MTWGIAFEPLTNEGELLARCRRIEGLSFMQLGRALGLAISDNPLLRKGWAGQAVELALGTSAKNKSSPDFCTLGIELKTVPINHLGKPSESTFVASIPLLTLHQQRWETSQCFSKLRRVLWLPVEGDPRIPYQDRRIGRAMLWSPSSQEEAILQRDWSEFVLMISTGQLSEINASLGDYLQVRPKAAHGQSLCYGYDEQGQTIQTLPLGFYLRSRFTQSILTF